MIPTYFSILYLCQRLMTLNCMAFLTIAIYFGVAFYTVGKELIVASMGTPSKAQCHNTTVNNL